MPLQAFIGEYQWHNQLPWWAVLAHVSVAAAVWIACVSLATRVVAARPALAPQPPAMPAARPRAATCSAILREASSIISPSHITAPRRSPSVAWR